MTTGKKYAGEKIYFLRYMSLLITILILLVSFTVYYFLSSRRRIYDKASANLNSIKTNVESRLIDIHNTLQRLSLNNNIGAISNDSTNFFNLYTLQKSLASYKTTNSIIDEILLYIENEDRVTTSNGIGRSLPEPYGQYLKYFINSESSNNKSFWDNTYNSFFFNCAGPDNDYIACIQTIPIFNGVHYKAGNYVIFIPKASLYSIGTDLLGRSGTFSIHSPTGRSLTGTMDMQISDNLKRNTNQLHTYKDVVKLSSIASSGRIYSISYSKRDLLGTLYFQILLTCIMIIFIAILGTFCVAYIAQKRYAPIKDMIDSIALTKEGSTSDSQADLKSSVDFLISRHKTLSNQISEYLPKLQVVLIQNILDGKTPAQNELESYKLNLSYNFYYVAVFRIIFNPSFSGDKMSALYFAKSNLEETLKSSCKCNLISHICPNNDIAFILEFDSEKLVHDTPNNIKLAFNSITQSHTFICKAGLGSACTSLNQVHTSYTNAKLCLNLLTKHDSAELMVFGEHTKSKVDIFIYPIEMEQKLINASVAGNSEYVMQLFNDIVQSNSSLNLSKDMHKTLLDELYATFCKAASNMRVDLLSIGSSDSNLALSDEANNDYTIDMIEDMFLSLCDKVIDTTKKKNLETNNAILSYISDNYTDYSLTIASVAENVGCSKSYISKFFADTLHMTFLQYIEDMRLKKAVILLSESDLTIEEISTKVGYSGGHVFRRAYKRKYGTSPSEVRSSSKHTKVE